MHVWGCVCSPMHVCWWKTDVAIGSLPQSPNTFFEAVFQAKYEAHHQLGSLCSEHRGRSSLCVLLIWAGAAGACHCTGFCSVLGIQIQDTMLVEVLYPLSHRPSWCLAHCLRTPQQGCTSLIIPSSRFCTKTTGTLTSNLEIFSQSSRPKDHPICNPKTPSSGFLRLNRFGNAVCISRVKWLALKVNTDWNMV